MFDTAIRQCLALSREARGQRGVQLARTLVRLDALLRLLADGDGLDGCDGGGANANGAAPEAAIELDLAGYLCGWDAGAERLFGYARAEALGRHILFLYADDDGADDDGAIAELFQQAGSGGAVRRRKKSGEVLRLHLTRAPVLDGAGEVAGMAVRLALSAEPLSGRERVRLHERIVEDSEQGVLITDADERIVAVNPAFTRITGYSAAEALGQGPALLRPGVPDAAWQAGVRAALAGTQPWRGETVGRRKNGALFPQALTIGALRDDGGRLSHTFALFSDLSAYKDAEARIQRLANYDSLTGLPNRCLLDQLMGQALAGARRSDEHGALLLIDINRVGAIGDTLGPEVGDQLLVAVGCLLRAALRDADILARVDRHKFVVALLDIEKREHAAIVAQKLLDTLAAPIPIDSHSLQVGASIGISVYPEDGPDMAALFRFADVAVAKAARGVEAGYLFYREEMNQRAKEHLRLESELRVALAASQLQLHYQPKVSLRSGRIVGAEALLRWQHPSRGMVPPGLFIPVAEETGLVLELGAWVLDEACRQIGAWRDAGLAMPPIAVNLSARQFDRHLPARIATALDRHGVRPDQLMLEITESLLMRGADQVVEIMNELVAMGLALALDDFGTGYSSLAYLKKFPISILKIDRSFVVGLPHEDNDCAIARAIVTMAQQLRQEIVAEGVETVEQMGFLRGLGCDQLQGYLFSAAVPAADFARMLREGRRLSFPA